MKFSTSLSLLALSAAAVSATPSDVLDLTASTFSKAVNFDGLTLVEFFAPWCGHCKALAPHYEESATALKAKNIKLAKVDCTQEAELCQDHGIQGYPTLKVFNAGVPSDYTGPRKADGIISYMTKQSLPAVSQITAADHDEFKASDKVVLISYTPPGTDAPKPFTAYANAHRDSYLFGHTNDPSALSLASISSSTPTIVLYKSFDEGSNTLPPSTYTTLTADSLGAWIKIHAMPLLDEISPENFATYAAAGIPIAYTFVDPASKKSNKALLKSLESIASEYKGKISFVSIDAVKFVDHAKSLNLPGDVWPAFAIQDLVAQTKYPLKSGSVKWDASTVKEFVRSFEKGEIKPDVKSAPVPKQTESVWELVSEEYEKVVYEDGNDKDVFIEFFAPWCGHCKKLAPIWTTLADRYADDDTVLIAKFDATENDLPPSEPFKISGFPTLKFKPAGSDVFVDYQGDRSLESLIEFVEENATGGVPQEQHQGGVDDEDEEEEKASGHDEL